MARVQLALNVADLSESITFYRNVFGAEPHKIRDGYANFEIADPPLKLVLIQIPAEERGTGTRDALNHLGIEVDSTADVDQAAVRVREAGLIPDDERDTTCCYALQDKFWVHDPAGTPWEFYTIKDDDPDLGSSGSEMRLSLAPAGTEGPCCR